MARIIWTEPALSDLDAIADCIALDDPAAASGLVRRIFDRVEQLKSHPESGSIPSELRPLTIYRQLVEPPCRVFYRFAEGERIYIVHVIRGERLLKKGRLRRGS